MNIYTDRITVEHRHRRHIRPWGHSARRHLDAQDIAIIIGFVLVFCLIVKGGVA